MVFLRSLGPERRVTLKTPGLVRARDQTRPAHVAVARPEPPARFGGSVRTVHGQGYRVHGHPEVTGWSTPQHNL